MKMYRWFITVSKEEVEKSKQEAMKETPAIKDYYVIGIKLDDAVYSLTYEDLKKALEGLK